MVSRKGVQYLGHKSLGQKRPLNGDTTRLPYADGLTERQKHLAREMRYKQQQFPGTQAARQTMGHMHWGARISYGDCLFFTISPNEQHSALVLKLSRYRRNDPCLRYADPKWSRLCGMNFPALSAKRRLRSAAADASEDPPQGMQEDIGIELPEYDLRRAMAAEDPLAVVEAHRINICLRLAWLLGVRMCPDCPRCNAEAWGCQDLFGSNMRPSGGKELSYTMQILCTLVR